MAVNSSKSSSPSYAIVSIPMLHRAYDVSGSVILIPIQVFYISTKLNIYFIYLLLIYYV